MSLVRVGLSENKKFGANYDAIFGKKPKTKAKKPVKKVKKRGSK